MNSKGHEKLLLKAIEIFNIKFKEFEITNESDIAKLKKGVVDPDRINKTIGSHYAIFDKATDTFNNRIKSNPDNAYTNFLKYFDMAIKNNDLYYLGFSLHFVQDMLTIPHATGIKIAPLYRFGRHRRYEKNLTKNMDRFFIYDIDISDLLKKDIKYIFKLNVDLINSYKNKLNKKYYDEINSKIVPLMLKYTIYFIYLYFMERSYRDVRN